MKVYLKLLHFCSTLAALLQPFTANATLLVDPMQHELQVGNETTFVAKVKVARQTTSTAAFFYTPSDSGIKKLIDKEIDVVSRDLKGIFTIVAIDCSNRTLKSICEAELGSGYKTPILRVYPKLPVPAYNYSGELTSAKVKRELVKHVASQVEIINSGKLPDFMGKFETMPKALLFSDKTGPNYMYKALSLAMDKKLLLGFVNVDENPELKTRYKIKSLPSLIVIKPDTKVDRFEGTFDYQSMFDWLNVYAETFLLGSGYDVGNTKATKSKPWLHDQLPQLTIESHMDICFNKSHGFCVIYMVNGKISNEDRQMMIDLSSRYTGQFTGKWMWMDLESEKGFAEMFNQIGELPSVVIFNPKKRLRYMLFDGQEPVTRKGIEEMLEKVLGGDARFTLVKGDKLPNFAPIDSARHDEL
ncbi:Thioredoxin family protein [Babesia bovis T2Bo]|uniref:Thioredoxin domain-containing protein n=1 Tax=Babesia bovis TaxID=5865 RepID=A7ANN7_BABBO|nr:Thioredoxin family protein [Babesia bovis T2Bo]EDO08171.1 Thioredoxin family protein [Babesia bovis T2Bo]|eukprot:XP_001611739.1 hypothetical protein [Babesia bovis T2Bo]